MTVRFKRMTISHRRLFASNLGAACFGNMVLWFLVGGWLVSSGLAYQAGAYGHTRYEEVEVTDMDCPFYALEPNVVPRRILIHTQLVTGDAPPLLWQDLDYALREAYDVPMQIVMEPDRPGFRDGVLHVAMRIHVDRHLVHDGNHAQGLECGGLIVVAYPTRDPGAFQLAAVHEVGHALGLCHVAGTYMHPSVPAPRDRDYMGTWNPLQERFLDALQKPGEAYPLYRGRCHQDTWLSVSQVPSVHGS